MTKDTTTVAPFCEKDNRYCSGLRLSFFVYLRFMNNAANVMSTIVNAKSDS